MGHSDLKTTERYLHYKRRAGEAALLAEAFAVEELTPEPGVLEELRP